MDRFLRRGKAAAVATQSNDQALSYNQFSGSGGASSGRGAESKLVSVLADNPPRDSLILDDLWGLITRLQLGFPPGSIENGTLCVGDICDRAARVLDIPEGMVLQLSFNSTKLEDHSRSCRDYHVKNKSVLDFTLVPNTNVGEASESYKDSAADGKRLLERKRARKSTKGKAQSTSSIGASSETTISTSMTHEGVRWGLPQTLMMQRETSDEVDVQFQDEEVDHPFSPLIFPHSPHQRESFVDERKNSGGVRVGDRVIEFGDFPGSVDLDLTRKRSDMVRNRSGWRQKMGTAPVETELFASAGSGSFPGFFPNNDNMQSPPQKYQAFNPGMPSPIPPQLTPERYGSQSPLQMDQSSSPAIPFAIPIHPTPKIYRSQSYSTGQFDPNSSTPGPNPNTTSFSSQGKPLQHSRLRPRPSQWSLLSEMSNDGELGKVKETNTAERLFVKPPGMRPNSVFIGRELELAELHKLLMDKKRRSYGSSAVLLQSLPGGGKTHLARQYVYRHLDEYPGGVFFIRAKSLAELSAGFWKIARVAKLSWIESDDPQEFIKEVRAWFNMRHDWLLVLDGIHFSDDEKNLGQFIPDSTATSIIYTSTEQSIAPDNHFKNLHVIRIPFLSAREAQTLLLTELDIKNPSTNDQKNSMDLVQQMGFLPVEIHATAQRLKATEEPLAKFTRSYRNAPKLATLNSFSAVVDYLTSLGAIEALNLIKIISFFSQYIPVEMIVLGISSIDLPVKSLEPLTGRSLNNTIKTLERFALIERNESTDDLPLSSDESGNLNGEIDTIRIHSVVQDFFVDSCRAENQTSVWLNRAVALFCQSLSIALQRINRTTNRGLVDDFRMYEIHGGKLLDQLQRQARKEQTPSGWQSTLGRSLDTIKFEINERTANFSNMDAFRVSVFDRSTSATSSGPPSPIEQAVPPTTDSDLESLASIEDEIFSTTGSFSTNSTVSSIRFTVIELLVRKFIEDEELSPLYEEAIKRMPNERFVRNQRRLLKQFFLDLQPQAKTPIQEQAIGILRGRRERTSIAEQIWSIINLSNVSRHAQMTALLTQNPDKQSQIDRFLAIHGTDAEVEAAYNEQDTLSEESKGSDSEGSGYANEETKYLNVDIATEFLVGGPPFKQYKLNLRGFLRLDVSPSKLHELVIAGDVSAVAKVLSTRFDEVAQFEFDWLHELLEIGCSFDEMARLLVDGEQASPWVLLNHRVSIKSLPSTRFHQMNCVHTGGQKLDTAPRVVNTTSRNTEAITGIDKFSIQKIVGELCGIAGAIPLSSDECEYEWMSSVRFTGENNVAWVAYASEDSPATPTICVPVLRMLDALQRAYHAFGYLQETGICCDTFTVLVLRAGQLYNDVPSVELSHIEISLVERLYKDLHTWKMFLTDGKDATNILRACGLTATTIISTVSDAYSGNPDQSDSTTWLNECSLAIQVITVGILSYTQGHTGSLHPEFLVDPLTELHLLGNDSRPPRAHIMVNLFQLTCIGNMLQKPVLVFRNVDIDNPFFEPKNLDDQWKYDLLASPEDIADTWSPARFVVDTATTAELGPEYTSRKLWVIEIGGGTIAHIDPDSPKLHWSEGSRTRFGTTFDSKEKILIGGVTVNDKCPLNEAESWRHPATNAYLRHLGTRQGGWELQEKQVGLQGGQYAVLAFNATYVKQNGVTLKQQQLMLPSNEIDLAFLNSTCGLQISFCTGVARRVALRELLADVMVEFVESKVSKPAHWEELKSTHSIVQNFRLGNLGQWFDGLTTEQRESAIYIVRSMLEVLKDTGIDKNDEELVIAWVRRESPYSCLRLRCEKTSLWARILADSEDCATFACITPLCLEIKKHKCRELAVAPWHNVSSLLDTAVCPQLSNRELVSVLNTLAPFKLEHQVSYWIGKSGSNLIAKVWLTNDPEPRLVVRRNAIPEKYRSRLPKAMVERLGRLREQQISNAGASQVVILAEKPL